uniref:Uncharacterized protein n=1 Tax=Arundo donax TaxID=35708 RepID=A0A0A9BNT5_ARUDO
MREESRGDGQQD